MPEKKRFDNSGASKRKRQKEKTQKHEEVLSKTPTLFDLGSSTQQQQNTKQSKQQLHPVMATWKRH